MMDKNYDQHAYTPHLSAGLSGAYLINAFDFLEGHLEAPLHVVNTFNIVTPPTGPSRLAIIFCERSSNISKNVITSRYFRDTVPAR
jgi:hypothetical protein